jgi:alpha-1,3-mannosyltransferase
VGRHSSYVPTLDQRERVFTLLSTLTGYHTRECTRDSQRAYRRQVYERYEPLVGYERFGSRKGALNLIKQVMPGKLRRSFWKDGQEVGEDGEVEKIFRSSDRERRDRARLRGSHDGHKYFFAINLYNSFDVIPDLFSTMFKASSILGFHNVFVSVYENGSSDQTKALLRMFDALCRSVGLRVVIRTSLRTRGAFHHRIEYLAEVRNAALAPLQELRDAEGEVFDSVIFMNDVLPCVDDLLELIWQSRKQNAGITCGSDYIFHGALVPLPFDRSLFLSDLFSVLFQMVRVFWTPPDLTLTYRVTTIDSVHVCGIQKS